MAFNIKEKENKNEKKIENRKIVIKNVNKFLNDNFKWFVFLVFIIILFYGYFNILSPKFLETKKVVDVINQRKEEDYYKKKAELEKIMALLLAYSKIDATYLEKINSIAPEQNNMEEIFTELNYIISKNGLVLQSLGINEITVRDPKAVRSKNKDYLATGEIGNIKVSLAIKGTDYESFKRLLVAFENNLRIIDVVNVNFDPAGRNTNLVLSMYYSKD